jgi:hypothetical protein
MEHETLSPPPERRIDIGKMHRNKSATVQPPEELLCGTSAILTNLSRR